MPFVIGIAGGSGSGKTTIARAVLAAVPAGKAVLIGLDNYYKDLSHLSLEERAQQNFDHPDSFDFSLLVTHLEQLQQGRAVDIPTYDFPRHTRSEKTEAVPAAPVILVEGILTLAINELVPFFDLKVYVEADADLRFMRRLTRDIEERGREVEDVIRQYQETVKPMFVEYVAPSKRLADVILPENRENPAGLDVLVMKVKAVIE